MGRTKPGRGCLRAGVVQSGTRQPVAWRKPASGFLLAGAVPRRGRSGGERRVRWRGGSAGGADSPRDRRGQIDGGAKITIEIGVRRRTMAFEGGMNKRKVGQYLAGHCVGLEPLGCDA